MALEIVSLVETAQTRLKAEIDAQLGALVAQHQQAVDAARSEAHRELDQQWSARLEAVRQEAAQRALVPSRDTEEIVNLLGAIDRADTVSDTLHGILRAAAAAAPRAALFILPQPAEPGSGQGPLTPWIAEGVASLPLEALRPTTLAVPLLLDGVPVAMLYGDDKGGEKEDAAPSAKRGWPERLQLIAGIGATRLGYLTALRTVQAVRWRAAEASVDTSSARATAPTPSSDDDGQAARRYARLLVSEIKLYNEAAVRTGRQHGDLLQRLRPEIDRARRLYEQRVPATVHGRAQLFDDELVQTLAGGDALLLG